MQLTGPEILRRMQIPNPENPNGVPDIKITPFDEKCLGSNSYDLHLTDTLVVYTDTIPNGMRPVIEVPKGGLNRASLSMQDWFYSKTDYYRYLKSPQSFDPSNPAFYLDPKDKNKKTTTIKIPESGVLISPKFGYLGATLEYTETRNLFPYIDGKSSIGRLFLKNHFTAGRGDDGFCGTWTLEIEAKAPTILYPYMRIGQIYYEMFVGGRNPYDENPASHYNGQVQPTAAAAIAIEKIIGKRQK